MLTQMKGWSQIRSVRRRGSTRQWSRRKKDFIQRQRKSPVLQLFLTLELHLLLVKEREKRRYVPFPSNIELSFLSGSSSSETRYDSFPADSDLCCSAARLARKQVYSALLPPPALHKVNQGPIGSPFLGAPSSKDEPGIHPLYWWSNNPLACPRWCYAVISPGTVPLWSWGHK